MVSKPTLLRRKFMLEQTIIMAFTYPALAHIMDVTVGGSQNHGFDGVAFFLPLYRTGGPDLLLLIYIGGPLSALFGRINDKCFMLLEIGLQFLHTAKITCTPILCQRML